MLFNETGIYNITTGQQKNFEGTRGETKSLIRYPYVFQIDQYLPIFRVYDQNKSLLYEASVLSPSVPHDLDYLVCPDFTYYFEAKCIKHCPQTYFAYMNGVKGSCSLSPYPDSRIDVADGVAFNASNPDFDYYAVKSRGCPSPSIRYQFGCYCIEGKYFDRKKWICTTSKHKVRQSVVEELSLMKDFA